MLTLTSPNGHIDIYVESSRGIYFCQNDFDALSAYFSATSMSSSIRSLSTTQLNSAVEQAGLLAKSLSDLVWCMAFHLSQGRLLKGHLDQDIVKLTNWPNLAIQGCQKYMKLAAFMQKNAACLDIVASKTATSLADVRNFYNACALVGLVEKATKTEIHEKKLSDSKRAMLATIASRLQECRKEPSKLQ